MQQKKLALHTPVIVRWLDACSQYLGWGDPEQKKFYAGEAQTMGFVVAADHKTLTLAESLIHQDGALGGIGTPITLPWGMIEEIHIIEKEVPVVKKSATKKKAATKKTR